MIEIDVDKHRNLSNLLISMRDKGEIENKLWCNLQSVIKTYMKEQICSVLNNTKWDNVVYFETEEGGSRVINEYVYEFDKETYKEINSLVDDILFFNGREFYLK